MDVFLGVVFIVLLAMFSLSLLLGNLADSGRDNRKRKDKRNR